MQYQGQNSSYRIHDRTSVEGEMRGKFLPVSWEVACDYKNKYYKLARESGRITHVSKSYGKYTNVQCGQLQTVECHK